MQFADFLLKIAVTSTIIGLLIALALIGGGKADDDQWPGGMA